MTQLLTVESVAVQAGASIERRFGWLMAAVCAVGGGFVYFKSAADTAAIGLCLLSAALLGIATWRPMWLRPLSKLWLGVGLILGRIVSPLVLGAIFFLLITPVAFVGRLLGRDELRMRRSPRETSYWIEREPKGPAADSFKNQY